MGSRYSDAAQNRLWQDYSDRSSYANGDEIIRLDAAGLSERIVIVPINDFVVAGGTATAQWSLEGSKWFPCPYYDPSTGGYTANGVFALGPGKSLIFPDIGNHFRVIANQNGAYAAPATPNLVAGLTKDDGIIFGGGSGTAASGSAAGSPSQITPTDQGGTTSAAAGTFTTLRPANGARQFLTVTNTNATGTLYVYLGASGGTAPRSIALAPGQNIMFDAKVPTTALQVGGSVASMTYACFEG